MLELKTKIPTIQLSKNSDNDEFLNAFLYHNEDYFSRCIYNDVKKIYTIGQNPKAPIAKVMIKTLVFIMKLVNGNGVLLV